MTNQELSKVAQAAAYVDVLVNAGLIDKETEDFCINKVKQLLDELLKEENKIQITTGPTYRSIPTDCKDQAAIDNNGAIIQKYIVNPFIDKVSTTDGLHPAPTITNTTTARNM